MGNEYSTYCNKRKLKGFFIYKKYTHQQKATVILSLKMSEGKFFSYISVTKIVQFKRTFSCILVKKLKNIIYISLKNVCHLVKHHTQEKGSVW